MGKLIDLTGQKFGRLTVIDRATNGEHRRVRWNCQCTCGNITIVTTHNLRNGYTTSCGCSHNRRDSKQLSKSHTVHGESASRLYNIWSGAKSRCVNEDNKDYVRYGARGISMCEEWANTYECFRDWSIDNDYDETKTLDRIDVNLGYSPDNCRWATQKQQQRNRRNNILLTFNGETKCVSEWAEEMGVDRHTLLYRVHAGWSVEQILTRPINRCAI